MSPFIMVYTTNTHPPTVVLAWQLEWRTVLLQGDECAEQDALRLKEQLDSGGSAKVEVEGEEVTITTNMVDIKKESRSGG